MQIDVSGEGDAIYSQWVTELSKCQPEALCVCLVCFPSVCLPCAHVSYVPAYLRVYVRACMYFQNAKSLSRYPSAAADGHQEETKDG